MIGARPLALVLVIAVAAPARAQHAACSTCKRGDELIDRLRLAPLRDRAHDLATLALREPLSQEQYAQIVELRTQLPAVIHLGGVDDKDLGAIAAALCQSNDKTCTDATTLALRCLADRCEVRMPDNAGTTDLPEVPSDCHPYRASRSPPFGLGVDWGNGWQSSRYPNDGRAWSIGVEGRLRFGNHVGAVARVDRVAGRDAGEDADGNGKDDTTTGSITRIVALGGPSLVLDHLRYEDTARSLRLDLLGGYIDTTSQPAESGPAAGIDLALQIWALRFGVRVVKGFGDARDTTMVLGHFAIGGGARPLYRGAGGCEVTPNKRSSRFGVGMDFPTGGYGISKQLGWTAPSVGVELLFHLSSRFDALAHADMLIFPGDDRDRVIHDAVLGGLRYDHGPRRGRGEELGFSTIVMGGYTHSAGLVGASTGSGPVVDVSLGWGLKATDGSAYFRLHGRFGASPDNFDYRVIFISGGFEIHFDSSHWRRG